MLARSAEEISFYDVIAAIEGPITVNACLEDDSGCDQMPKCTMIGVWSEVQRSITEVLSRTTIAALRKAPCADFVGTSSLSSAA
jgi:DNA-binding IscR family transcriptional regulator